MTPKNPNSNLNPKPSRPASINPATLRASEARLEQLRREGEMLHLTRATGIVPEGAPFLVATPETGYYGTPVVKPPQWSWEIPIYFFVGGAAGAAATIAKAVELAGADNRIVSDARWIAAIGGAISPVLLVSDLGMPSRFLNMLRIFKVQSPMSVGSWTLVVFSTSAALAAFAGALEDRLGRGGLLALVRGAFGGAAAFSGLGLSTYTGVLIGATANPVWAEHVSTLPIHFAASGLGTAVSLLELRGHHHHALNTLGIGAAALETALGLKIELQNTRVNKRLKTGTSGTLMRAAGFLSGPLPLSLRLLARNSRTPRAKKMRRAASLATIVGSFLTRQAWMSAGKASAADNTVALKAFPGK